VGLADRDVVCRNQAGEFLDTLAAAAELTRNGRWARGVGWVDVPAGPGR
jgi:hypothetical protein